MRYTTLLLSLFILFDIFPQEKNITSFLKKIELGEYDSVKSEVIALIKNNPTDPSVIFLDAVITENADEAIKKYTSIYQKYPRSKYADASVYRLYSYFFALGSYIKAQGFANKLKSDYPTSPYIKMLNQIALGDISKDTEPLQKDRDTDENNQQKDIESNDKTTETDMNVSELKSYYTLQVGAFTNLNNAKELKKKIESHNLQVEIKEKSIGGTDFHIVFVGKYDSKIAAEEVIDIMTKAFSIEGKVVYVKQ